MARVGMAPASRDELCRAPLGCRRASYAELTTMRTRLFHPGAAALAALLLAGCDPSSGPIVGDLPDIYSVTAVTENLTCGASSCNIDIRGTARDDDSAFVTGASVFTW